MNKIARSITVAGLGALAALAVSAAPAQAAGSAAGRSATVQAPQHHDRGQVAGFYRSPRACELAGRIGERFGSWDRHECGHVRFGSHRGSWALTVSQDRHGSHHGDHSHHGHDSRR